MTRQPEASFDAVARLYASARPSYPRESVEWLVADGAKTVVDVGAGTGLFTRLLIAPGRSVIAVEPSQAMLDELRSGVPRAEVIHGTAERMPLPAASADAIVFAQAWHWVDVPKATAEVARVLRPGGTLGLVWNLRDERIGWVRELGAAMRADGDHFRGEDDEDPDVGAPFGEPQRLHIEWVRTCTIDEVIDDVRSRSYFALLPPAEQRSVEDAVRKVLDDAPKTGDGGAIDLPYVTASFLYPRP